MKGSPKPVWVQRAYYPGYMFVRFDDHEFSQLFRFLKLGAFKSFRGLVSFNGWATPIADDVMQVLIAGADENGLMGSKEEVSQARFKAMQSVRFIDGPLLGLIAQVIKDKGNNEVKLLLELFGSKREISAKADHLEAA